MKKVGVAVGKVFMFEHQSCGAPTARAQDLNVTAKDPAQPLRVSQDWFAILTLPQTYTLDAGTLESAYFAAQRQYHPDRFVNKSAEEKLAAAQKSADINEAYNTLKHPLKRAQHLLALAGINALEGADNATLMEMMELQEAIAEGEKPDITALIERCEASLAKAFENGDLSAAKKLTIRLGYLYKMH
jgi:molecular chaperone HscB